jgi:hypothetical protein
MRMTKRGQPKTWGQTESVSEIDVKRVLYSMEKALKMAE